jgi:hypothetical protein
MHQAQETRNEYSISVGKPGGELSVGRPKSKHGENFKANLKRKCVRKVQSIKRLRIFFWLVHVTYKSRYQKKKAGRC